MTDTATPLVRDARAGSGRLRWDALGSHRFEPGDVIRNDRAGRPIRGCRICGRPGRGSGHRLHGLMASAPAQAKIDAQRERRASPRWSAGHSPAIPAELPPAVDVPSGDGRHAFVLGAVLLPPDKRGARFPACATCGKSARSHPRTYRGRGATRQDRPGPTPVPVLAAVTRSGSSAAPATVPGAQARRRTSALPAAELVGLAIAVDRILALPADLVGWRLRMRVAAVREALTVPEYPTLDVAELPGEVDPEPATPAQLERRPHIARSAPIAVDSATQAMIRGIRDDRTKLLARRAVDAGARLSMTGSGHLAIDVGGQRLIVSTTMNGGRRGHSWGNVRAAAKRAGIDVSGI